jgi:hypothetical protein
MEVCEELNIPRPKNLGDVIYTFRYRQSLPQSILETQPKDRAWLILGDGGAGAAVFRAMPTSQRRDVGNPALTLRT